MTKRACETCGEPLDVLLRAGTRYCSGACRQKAYRRRSVPPELASRDRWVLWKPIKRGERWTKMPVQTNGRPASSTNPLTWARHAEVRGSRRTGFVLGGGVGCIDLDHCLVDGAVAPWAQAVLDVVGPTWVEVSPSGDGLHVWGLLPAGPGRVIRDGVRSVETYSSARFMTVTGKRWPGSVPRLADLRDVVATL